MTEFIARHRITSGMKGVRQVIEPKQRFNTDDYKDVSDKEWTAMLAQGTITRPDDPSYAAVTGLRTHSAEATAEPESVKPARRGRRAASGSDDDDDL